MFDSRAQGSRKVEPRRKRKRTPSDERRRARRAQGEIEAKSERRRQIWRERQPAKGDPRYPEEELLARDLTRPIRTERLSHELQRLFTERGAE